MVACNPSGVIEMTNKSTTQRNACDTEYRNLTHFDKPVMLKKWNCILRHQALPTRCVYNCFGKGKNCDGHYLLWCNKYFERISIYSVWATYANSLCSIFAISAKPLNLFFDFCIMLCSKLFFTLAFYQLESLQHMNVSNNRFDEFPLRLCFAESLKTLKYSQDNGVKMNVLPENISNLDQLEVSVNEYLKVIQFGIFDPVVDVLLVY